MIWNILTGLTLAALVIYIYYLLLFYRGIKKGRDLISYKKPFVSIVVAARNEEKNIIRLLTSLVNQNYSSNLYEIIIANDQSKDKTAAIVESFSEKWPQVKLINVKNREKVISPKKNALDQAIKAASGEIILTTDADCLVGKHWLEAILANFEDADMVAGFSRTQLVDWQKTSLVQKFEHFDFLAIFAAAAGAIANGRYFSCSGQNLAYRRAAFEQVGRFDKIMHLISGDDVNLMQLFRLAGMRIRFAFNPHSFAYTMPVRSWKQLINQRGRWASNMKWQLSLNPEFFIYLAAAFLLVLAPIALLFYNWKLALGIIFFRLITEYIFLKTGFTKFQVKKNKLNFYFVWFILQPVYFIVVAVIGAVDQFSWKK